MAANVLYNYPTAVGVTVAPTATQGAACSLVSAQVGLADADTTAVITHNLGVTATELTQGFPVPIMYPTNVGTNPSTISVALTNSVAITLTKGTAVGSGGTWTVIVLRPHTLIR